MDKVFIMQHSPHLETQILYDKLLESYIKFYNSEYNGNENTGYPGQFQDFKICAATLKVLPKLKNFTVTFVFNQVCKNSSIHDRPPQTTLDKLWPIILERIDGR